MAFKSVLRRGSIVAISAASAVVLAACGAGQVSQTADQLPAVDGSLNIGKAEAGKSEAKGNPRIGSVALRDVHVLVDPEGDTAALKFSASNQQRATDSFFTLKSIKVDGVGDVTLKPAGETPSYKEHKKGDKSVPRNCQLVVGPESVIAPLAKTAKDNTGCIAYFSNTLNPESLVGEKSSAAAQHRNVTFEFTDKDGAKVTYPLTATVSADILEAGQANRGADGQIETPKQAK
ncbi:hypothetical protein [Corynebacterium lactis]|uniref:Lipoprotein LpqE n=1 Tax=Corynebacterium lactis RW2-5 TaxID=1408189 RepID=A0A0K2H3S1_9CORY|nr:hypothetical protein [Corynebacterium lactis]ALA68695.1 hypothetical protein CLAC_10680 [Corynebacterium lactis RW2-5]